MSLLVTESQALAKRFALCLAIAFIVISSLTSMFIPAAGLAVTANDNEDISYITRYNAATETLSQEKPILPSSSSSATSGISASPTTDRSSSPSVPIQDDGFTSQAALQHPLLLPSNNIVNTRATYDIGFRTTTAGIIKTIEMVFPAGTIASNSLIEFAGIGPGLLTRPTANTLLYTVFNPVNVPANTAIRLEVGFFNNPVNPISSATVQVTTRDTVGNIIDGPTSSNPYVIKQVGTSDIADGAVTGSKIAGTSKLIFGTCTGSIPALAPGQAAQINCAEVNAQLGDETVNNWSDIRFGQAPILMNSVVVDGEIIFGFDNPRSAATAAQPSVVLSYIIFKK